MPRTTRGVIVTAVGATVGAVIGGLLAYQAAWFLDIPQCVQESSVCLKRFVAVFFAGGWLGTVLGGVLALRMAKQDHLAWTALTLGAFIGLGILTWLQILSENANNGTVVELLFFVGPVLVPVLAMAARAVALRCKLSGARS